MPAKRRLTMRQLRQLLRLSVDGISVRDIGVMLGIARRTVQDNLDRAKAAGLTWPLPGDLRDDVLEARLSPAPASIRDSGDEKSQTGRNSRSS